MIKVMKDCERDAILNTADAMCLAAKTAPKGSGRDTVVACVLTGEDKDALSKKMREMGEATGVPIFDRDAGNLDASTAVVIIGCKRAPFGMSNCSMCGYENCAKMKKSGGNCVFNITDLGIAVGSAVSIAADNRIDNRVMYTIGRAALKMNCLGDDVDIAWGIPLFAGSKSVFFDRAPGATVNLSTEE